MARIRLTTPLRNDRAGRNKRKRPSTPVGESRRSFRGSVNWSSFRLWGVSLVFAGLWILLLARAYQVQIIRGSQYAEQARRAHIATEVATGRRGSILDRKGNVLAKSVEVNSVAVRPADIRNPDTATELLSAALSMPPSKARKIVASKRPFVWAERKVSPRTAESIRKAALSGVSLVREYERAYPFKHLAGQLLGFVNVDEKGIEGLELAFNNILSGQRKRKVMQRDAAGRRLYSGTDEVAEDLAGENLVLTIDTQVQFFAESALSRGVEDFGARWAACMVVDVPTGDILAWAEYPFFNPNRPSDFNMFTRRNKTAMDALEQGSTIKPFLIAAALQEGVVTPESEYDCEKGRWRLHNVTIRDTSAHSVLPVKDIVKVSSNIGMAKIGLDLGTPKYHQYLSRLGFGSKTDLPLAGENKGIVHQARQWTDVDLASASFGQSFSATLVQMAQAYLCLANDGVKKNLRLELSAEDEMEAEPERIFSSEVMREVREMLRGAVEESGGTGSRARIKGLVVGGKTGTAQKASGDAYGSGRVASFVGMLPVEEPRYLMLVMLDEPQKNQYGGVVAAPIFRNVAMQTMAYHGLLPESTPAQALLELERKKQDLAAQSAKSSAQNGESTEWEVSPEIKSELVNMAQTVSRDKLIPPVVGMGVRKAVETFASMGMVPEIKGEGNTVIRQEPEAGASFGGAVASSLSCTIWLGESS